MSALVDLPQTGDFPTVISAPEVGSASAHSHL
jgi:hypothetical protein